MQRDADVEIHDVDKSGGFIGALYLNKTENAAITLVREGLATVHSYSADNLPWARQLYDAEVSSCYSNALGENVYLIVPFLRQKRNGRSATSVFATFC